MKKATTTLFLLLLSAVCFSQTAPSDPHWMLQWKDDFTNSSLYKYKDMGGNWVIGDRTTSYWDIFNDFPTGVEVFSSNDVMIDSTGLRIITKKEEDTCASCLCTHYQHYTSGAISSFTYGSNDSIRQVLHYGYIEAKIKAPDTYGLWPAFWLWNCICNVSGTNDCNLCGGPTCDGDHCGYYNEVDIFELNPGRLEGDESSNFYNQVHDKYHLTDNIHTIGDSHYTGEDYYQVHYINDYTNWHTYGLELSPSKLTYYVDGVAIRNTPNPDYPANPNGHISLPLNVILYTDLTGFVKWDNPDCHNRDYDLKDAYIDTSCANVPCDTLFDWTTYFDSPTYRSPPYSPANLNDTTITPPEMDIQYIAYYKLDNTNASSLFLSDLYPNPFSGNTTVSFTIPDNEQGTIIFYDALGRVLKQQMVSGTGQINVDASQLQSGIYSYTLTAGSQMITKKMVKQN